MRNATHEPSSFFDAYPHQRVCVAQVVDGLNVGGAELVAVNLANGLAHMGFDSLIIASRCTGKLADMIEPVVKRFCAGRTSRWDVQGMRRIAEYIDQEQIDILHSHNHTTSYLMRLVRLLSARKPLHVVHDHHGPAIGNRRLAIYDRLMLNHVDAYVSVSDPLRERAAHLLHIPSDRCIHIANGINIPQPRKHWLGRTTVIQVANVHSPKGHQIAVRAAALLRERIPDLAWKCVGDIPEPPNAYVNEVQSLIEALHLEECFQLLGPSLEVGSMLGQAHLGMLTSDAEGLPMTLLEYMAAELPVVVTAVGQCPALVKRSNSGLVARPGDAESVADAAFEILSRPDRGLSMGRRGREMVVAEFSLASMVEATAALYERLLAETRHVSHSR